VQLLHHHRRVQLLHHHRHRAWFTQPGDVNVPGTSNIGRTGTVWFTQETNGNAARITNAGVITEGKAVKGSGPFGITVAPNGDPWYTMMAANKIAGAGAGRAKRAAPESDLARRVATAPCWRG
jgi:virginiamycin B lyase